MICLVVASGRKVRPLQRSCSVSDDDHRILENAPEERCISRSYVAGMLANHSQGHNYGLELRRSGQCTLRTTVGANHVFNVL